MPIISKRINTIFVTIKYKTNSYCKELSYRCSECTLTTLVTGWACQHAYPHRISFIDSTLAADSRHLTSAIVCPAEEKSRSDWAELADMQYTTNNFCCVIIKKYSTFVMFDPTQPIENCEISTRPDPTQLNPTQPVGRPILLISSLV